LIKNIIEIKIKMQINEQMDQSSENSSMNQKIGGIDPSLLSSRNPNQTLK